MKLEGEIPDMNNVQNEDCGNTCGADSLVVFLMQEESLFTEFILW